MKIKVVIPHMTGTFNAVIDRLNFPVFYLAGLSDAGNMT
jgi:hypothetical protein